MSQDKHNQNEEELKKEPIQEETNDTGQDDPITEEESEASEVVTDDLQELQNKLDELQDSYLRLHAEYDNYRKRTIKEKSELIKSAGEKTVTAFLDVMDDFDLALKNIAQATSKEGITEGLELIHHKLISTLKTLGVNEMKVIGLDFNPEDHDAVAMVPATDDDQKGKIIECLQKGYTINDKVLRHPKVVVGN